MLSLFAEDFCNKLNPTLEKQNKNVRPENKHESAIKVDKRQFSIPNYLKLISIDFTVYRVDQNGKYSLSTTAFENSVFNVESLNDPLKTILTRSDIKSSFDSILLVLFDTNSNKELQSSKIFKQPTKPKLFIEIIYPNLEKLQKETAITNHSKGQKKRWNFFSACSENQLNLPIYLKVKEACSEFFFIRTVHKKDLKTEINEDLFEAIAETIVMSDLSSQENYTKLIIPYYLTCQMRYNQSKAQHQEQNWREFLALEAVQTNALAGMSVRRQYCQNVHDQKSTGMIQFLLSADKYKLNNMKNYMNKMILTYIKHDVPEANILSKPTEPAIAQERRNVHSWLNQFKS